MNIRNIALGALLMVLFAGLVQANTCPDPQTTSLKWGVPPSPWIENPYSPKIPDSDETTHFVRANILVAGLGKGVLCVYRNATMEYSIWWEVLTKIPARTDYNWIDTLGGFVCTRSLSECVFYTAAP